MKKFFYLILINLFFFTNSYAAELDKEFIDKRFDKIIVSDFCITNELDAEKRRDFKKGFVLGWHWDLKNIQTLPDLDNKKFHKTFKDICKKEGLLINNLKETIIKNNVKPFSYKGHDWIKLDTKRKKIFIKGYNAGIFSNNDEKKRMIIKYNVLFARLSDYYFYTNLREEFIGVSIKTIVDQIIIPQQ